MRSRFECPTSILSLACLLNATRGYVWLALVLALVSHAAFSLTGGPTSRQEARKPLTTQFVKRQPRLTKPLELRKRPRPRRRQLERKMVAVRAGVAASQAMRGVRPAEALQGLVRPQVEMARDLGRGSCHGAPGSSSDGPGEEGGQGHS